MRQSAMGISESEALLLNRAEWHETGSLAELTSEKLRQVTFRMGIDFATALLFDRLTRESRHAAFIETIDQTKPVPSIRNQQTTVAILPAAFYKEKPHSGADGKLVREEAFRLGFKCETVPLLSIGTLEENSTLLLEWLARHRGEQIILVSLCKSGADLKFALRRADARTLFCDVFAWVNICGTVNGSALVQTMMGSKLQKLVAWLCFKGNRHHLDALRELLPTPGGPLASRLKLPDTMRLISLVGFPLKQHLTNAFMRKCHQTLSRLGPNDGGVLLHDVCGLPGLIYPIWGADHYLRPEQRARRIIAAVLDYLVGS